MSATPLTGHLHAARSVLGRRRIGGAIARTAGYNVASSAAGALSGLIIARAAGPAVRGDYAAVTSWFGVLLIAGEVGQSAAVCYYVAREPDRARSYVATSRAMQLVTGGVVLAIGILLAPLLAHGDPGLTDAYRIVFAGSVFTFIGTSYSFALQATDPSQWNLVRVCQPVLALAGVIALARLHHLTLDTAVATVIATTAIQLGYAYCACRRRELAPGRARKDLVRPLAAYGLPQVASIAPATLNLYLALLVLSQVVSPAALGNYAVASSFTMVPVPLVTAIGYVAFPRLAARRALSASDHRMKRVAVTASIGLASAIMLPVAAVSYWLIPAVFGPAYHGAAPLLWILTPGAIFLSSGSVVGDLLRGTGRPGLVALAQGLAAVATVILLVVLLPSTGVAAAAIAQSVAYGVALAVMIRLLGRPPAQARARHRRAAAHQKEDSCG